MHSHFKIKQEGLLITIIPNMLRLIKRRILMRGLDKAKMWIKTMRNHKGDLVEIQGKAVKCLNRVATLRITHRWINRMRWKMIHIA
jgi:hypothetical protein